MTSQRLSEQRSTHGDPLLAQALENLASVLLRLGINAPRAESLLRTAFVHAAEAHVRSQGARVNQSQIATLAGINRVDVRNVLRTKSAGRAIPLSQHSRLERVLAAWRRDAKFLNRSGRPRPLSYRGKNSEFSRLVRRYGRDVSAKSILEQLLRIGAVAERAGNLVISRNSDARSSEANAARADLKFLEAQLRQLRFRFGKRAYVTRSTSVGVQNGSMARRLQRTTIEKVHLLLSALDAMSDQETSNRAAPAHRVIVTATVATESRRESDENAE